MKDNSRDPLSPEAFEAVRAKILEMSREELMTYLEWRPDIAEDMKFPQHPPYPGTQVRAAISTLAEPQPHVGSRASRKSRLTTKA